MLMEEYLNKEEIRYLIALCKLESAIQRLRLFCRKSSNQYQDILNQIIILSLRLHDSKNKLKNGTIDANQDTRTKVTVGSGILELLSYFPNNNSEGDDFIRED